MARQWLIPGGGFVDEDGGEEYLIPGVGFIGEDQAAVVSAGLPWIRRRRRFCWLIFLLIPGILFSVT